MLAQNFELNSSSIDFSAVVANSIARKLCGGNQYTQIFVVKIGVTRKGQPWIVYRVHNKVRSQFLSRSLWDKAKPFLYFAYSVESYTATELNLSATCITIAGVYSLTSRVPFGQGKHRFSTVCTCNTFAKHSVCVHARFADTTYLALVKYFDTGKLTVVDNCIVAATPQPSSLPVVIPQLVAEVKSESEPESTSGSPQCNRLWDSRRKVTFTAEDGSTHIGVHLNVFDRPGCEAEIAHGAPYKLLYSEKDFLFLVYSPVVSDGEQQSTSLCESLWSSRPKLSCATIEGSEYAGVRLSILERPTCEEEIAAGAPFKIVLDLREFPYLVPKLSLLPQEPNPFTVPAKILAAHRQAKQRQLGVFDGLDSAVVHWSSDSGNWRSSTGQVVTSKHELNQVVANQLSVGYSVYIDNQLVSFDQMS